MYQKLNIFKAKMLVVMSDFYNYKNQIILIFIFYPSSEYSIFIICNIFLRYSFQFKLFKIKWKKLAFIIKKTNL